MTARRDAGGHLQLFLDMLAAERGAAANTLEAYRRDIGDFIAFLGRHGVALEQVQPVAVGDYLVVLSQAGRAPASRARALSAIRQFFKFLVAEGLAPENPARRVAGPRRLRPLPKTLSVAEVDRLLVRLRLQV